MRHKILEQFSAEARADAASRVYDQTVMAGEEQDHLSYVCADGLCVMAVLLKHDFPDALAECAEDQWDLRTPSPYQIAAVMNIGFYDEPYLGPSITNIIEMNDNGELATPEAVAALFAED